MNKEQTNNLLHRYYKGETTLDEEEALKEDILLFDTLSPENDAFGFYESEGKVPVNIEDDILKTIVTKEKRKKNNIRRLFSLTSAAAVVIIVLGIYLDNRDNKYNKYENQFYVMEQAMFQVSETIQPHDQDDMLVLWVDDDVEIIIN
jgi:hypothetical protein